MSTLVALVSVCVECILYGVALAQFILSLYLLATRRRSGSKGPASTRPPVSWIFAPLILLFTICSAHLGVGIVKFHSYALTPSPALEGAKIALYTIANAIADSLMIWRIWAIWQGRATAVTCPVVLLACTAICGFVSSSQPPAANGWMTAFVACALLTKLAVTLTTVLWLRSLGLPGAREFLPPVLRILLTGSGASYALPLVALLALHLTGARAAAGVLLDALPQLALLLPVLGVVHGTFEAARSRQGSTLETCHHNTFRDRRTRSPMSFMQAPPPPMYPLTPAHTRDLPLPPPPGLSALSVLTDLQPLPPALLGSERTRCNTICVCCSPESPNSVTSSSYDLDSKRYSIV